LSGITAFEILDQLRVHGCDPRFKEVFASISIPPPCAEKTPQQ